VHKLIASWFGTGLIVRGLAGIDAGSGTIGSAFALGLSVWLTTIGVWAQVTAGVVVVGLALWSIAPLVDDEGDAGWIVIDEAAGTFLATIGLALGPALAAFAVFRLADIYKKAFPGVGRAEGVAGAAGIIADDLVAGVYGLAAGLIVAAL